MLDPLPLLFRFRPRFSNHKSRINAHVKLPSENDHSLYQHFHGPGHLSLEHVSIQLLERSKGEKELRDKEEQRMYKLGTLKLQGLNEDDGFYGQNTKTCVGARRR